jgi:hypothetical protein
MSPDRGQGEGSRGQEHPRWWAIRPAFNRKPVSYRCPICGERLPSFSHHMLLLPEGDPTRRRHAHTACVLAARRRGALPLREEVEPAAAGSLRRIALFLRRLLLSRRYGRRVLA